ncbi:MAG: PAS domain S-box protein [Armatimonadota bacterium]|nr:PAS domain S-box protein [bacterium]
MNSRNNGCNPNDIEAVFERVVTDFADNVFAAQLEDYRIREISVGRGVANLLGYEPEELRLEPELWFDIVHPADDPRLRKSFERLTSGRPLTEVYRVYRKDGQLQWIRVSAVASRESSKCASSIIGIVSDASTEKPSSDRLVQYKQLLDQTPNAVSLRDVSGRMIYCNEAYLSLFGMESMEEAMQTTYKDVIPAEDFAWFEQNMRPKIISEPWSAEMRIKRKDGAIKDVSVSTNVLLGLENEPVGVYAIFTDLTERKKIEEVLRENEEKYRNLIERSNDGVMVIQDELVRLVNQRFLEMSGYTAEELLGSRIANYLNHGESDELLDRYKRRIIGEEVSPILETVMTRADGSRIDVEINAGLIAFEDRPADLVLFRDIRERKRAEEAQRQSEEKYRTLIDSIDAIVLRIDPALRVLALGGQVEQWTGHSIAEMIDQPDLWHTCCLNAQDFEALKTALSRSTEDGTTVNMDLRIRHTSGQERWIRGRIAPRYDASGNLTHFDGVGLDITERMVVLQRESKHAALIAALVEVGQEFSSTLDTEKIVSTTVETTSTLLDCACCVLNVDPVSGRMRCRSTYSVDKSMAERIDYALKEYELSIHDIFGEESIRPVTTADFRLTSPAAADFAEYAGIGAMIAAPIYAEGKLFGILGGGRKNGQPAFDEEEVWFFSEVASHASAALTNASLYRRQATIAETLQRSLIPVRPIVPGLETATSYFPARGETEVGGDFFDIIDFKDGTVGLVVGDVSGKGLEAAIHTAEAKYMLRGFARQNSDPGYVMSALNQALWAFTGEFTFVTMFYALIDPSSGIMTYVNAGHECPLILRQGKKQVRELAPSGVVLGVVRDQDYVTHRAQLVTGDLLFCYTDGVIDVPCDGGRFGYERLVETVANASSATPPELLDYVTSAVQKCSMGIQPDDQVIVIVRLQE